MKKQVIDIIAETLEVEPETVTDDLAIGAIPEWTSMAQMRLIAALEERLGVEFPIDDLFDLTDVAAIIAETEKLKK